MLSPPRIVGMLTALAIANWAPSPATGCIFDGVFAGNLPVSQYPGSIDVAIAIRAAFEAGEVDRKAVEPPIPGLAGYWRVAGHLGEFRNLLSMAAAHTAAPTAPISVLLIDLQLWSRLSPVGRGFDLAVHTKGVADGDIVIVTSDALLAAILDRRIPGATALDRGLIAIGGPEERKAAARELLTAALGRALADARARDMRTLFFGPVRSNQRE